MARQESDKEDLLREATALVERVELSLADNPQAANITAGFRSDGAASVFFGSDPVYHFNAAGELRRAYADELLFKAEHGRLVSLRRIRKPDRVELVRHDLTETEQLAFFERMQKLIAELSTTLHAGRFQVVGQVGTNGDVVERLKTWLARLDKFKIASRANATRSTKRS